MAGLKGIISWAKDTLIVIEPIVTVKVVIAGGGNKGNAKVSLHLVEKTPELTPFAVPHQVANVNSKAYLLVVIESRKRGSK